MRGITFQDEPIIYNAIEFVDRLEEAYNPIVYKDVVPGRYEINPYGDVRDKYNDKILSSHDRSGYLLTALRNIDGSAYSQSNHRLVASAYCIKYDDSYDIVNHMDAEKYNNFYKNLEWCTQKHNMQHAYQNGLMVTFGSGEDNINAKLKVEEVHQICRLMETNMKYADILADVGLDVTKQNLDILTKIKSRHLWKHISDLYNIPEKEYRAATRVYSEDEIHNICKMKCDEYTNREVAKIFNIDMSIVNNANNFNRFIMKLKRKEIHTDITSQYNW